MIIVILLIYQWIFLHKLDGYLISIFVLLQSERFFPDASLQILLCIRMQLTLDQNSNVSHSEIEVLSVVNYIERVLKKNTFFLSSVVFDNSKAHNKWVSDIDNVVGRRASGCTPSTKIVNCIGLHQDLVLTKSNSTETRRQINRPTYPCLETHAVLQKWTVHIIANACKKRKTFGKTCHAAVENCYKKMCSFFCIRVARFGGWVRMIIEYQDGWKKLTIFRFVIFL